MTLPIFIDDATVANLLGYRELARAMEGAFIDRLAVPPRCVAEAREEDGRVRTLLAMPAVRPGGLSVTKLVTVFTGTGVELHSQIIVQDRNGQLIAIIAGHELTARRTAAASVLAARTLGAGDAHALAVVGAGRQARALMFAYLDCMPIREVRIWARRAEAAQELAQLAQQQSVLVQVMNSTAEAVRSADIVTCATGSDRPLFRAAELTPGAHIDLVGGFRPTMREADDELIGRATVVADTLVALTEAGDLIDPIANGVIKAKDVLLLADLLQDPGQRIPRREFTVFKSVGYAAEDLVAVELLLGKLQITSGAHGRGDGTPARTYENRREPPP